MSAIFGAINLDKGFIGDSLGKQMQIPLKKYKIDRFSSAIEGNATFGCGIQYIRNNSKSEALPYVTPQCLYTVDGMLDNRTELSKELNIAADIPDGEFFFRAYERWGMGVNSHIRGAYSFAVYDRLKNEVILSADHLCCRTLYYCRQDNVVYFATAVESILNALPKKPAVNESWITEFLSTDGLNLIPEATSTPYEGIKKMAPGQMIVFSAEGQREIEYYTPTFSTSDSRSDDEVFAELRDIVDTAANEICYDVDKTGILLSSGKDSAVVAASTAAQLKKNNKELYSYTSVPLPNYNAINNKFYSRDETPIIKELLNLHANINPYFYSGEGRDALTSTDDVLRCLEFPYKCSINMTWMYPLHQKAGEDGCSVLLTGKMGNVTFSLGTPYEYATTLAYSKLRPFKAVRVIAHHAKTHKLPRKDYIVDWVKNSFPRPSKKYIKQIKQQDYNKMFIKRLFAEKHSIAEKLVKTGFYSGAPCLSEFISIRKEMFAPDALISGSEFETKLGLISGVVVRDITRDIRVCKLCFSQPIERFAKFDSDGTLQTRRLVKGAFGDILPDIIADNKINFGLQGADWEFRLRKHLPEVIELFKEAYFHEKVKPYINEEYINRLIEDTGCEDKKGYSALRALACNFSAARFLINY